jgi:hypothetical protein
MQPSVIETYLHMDDNSNTNRKIAIPALQDAEEANRLPYQKNMHSRHCSSQHRAHDSASSAKPSGQPAASAACQHSPDLAEESTSSLEAEDSEPCVFSQQSPVPVEHSASFAEPPEQPASSSACQQSAGLAKENASSLDQLDDLIPSVHCQQSQDPVQDRIQEEHDFQPLATDQSFCGCQPVDDGFDSWPFNDEVSNSTLCATAEQLVNQYNIRGVDVAEIRKRLCPGFSKGRAPGEGCRVQNSILLELLDEISNDWVLNDHDARRCS